MINYYNGDLLKSNCDIICHQVNRDGIMGGGLALQIATKYPEVKNDYKIYCQFNNYDCGGEVCFSQINHTNKYIANCFSQNEDFTTNYKWLKNCFKMIKLFANKNDKIGVPFNYGCGIALGDWNKVLSIFKKLFENEKDIELQIWKL